MQRYHHHSEHRKLLSQALYQQICMVPKPSEILIVRFQQDGKECCDVKKLDCSHCFGQHTNNGHNQTLWQHSIIWCLFRHTITAKTMTLRLPLVGKKGLKTLLRFFCDSTQNMFFWNSGNLSFCYIWFHVWTHFLILAGSALYQICPLMFFGKMHFLLIPENEFFHEIKCNGMTSFMEFMMSE